MSAAQYELDPREALHEDGDAPAPASALKLQAAERLAAHRARRHRNATPQLPGIELASAPSESRASRIAAAVAERYAQSQTYHAFLAAEAEKAIHQAEAAAEVAVRTAKAVVATQQQLLSELELWAPTPAVEPTPIKPPAYEIEESAPAAVVRSTAGLTVKLYEDVGRSVEAGTANAVPHEHLYEDDRLALDEEIAFRQSPSFQEFLEPAVPLPANLIEFPRQLVAPRRARPRLAEGPLRDDAEIAPENAQLRIFEVEPDQISTQFLTQPESALPEWSSIRLSACLPSEAADLQTDLVSFAPTFLTAPLGLRVMSAIVDGCLISASFLAFTAMAVYTAGSVPTGQAAVLGAVGILAVFALAYQLLFFTFSDATPGMRYARIGLCTFSDDNPTRSAMRRRIVAILLAACPAGLGFVWAWLDDDRLGWHDRISRMYQRSY
ncbi:RDD family protein [Granulicella arctica]|uniref:RDD family protein n=1 Tax=Granulicella arctica TaxID=940613 RepID=UPI0021E07656|nr:RDD family protein [Granulicella arctica]